MFFRLTVDEAISLLEELDNNYDEADIGLGFPEEGMNSDEDSDISDDDCTGSMNHLGRGVLSATCDVELRNTNSDENFDLVQNEDMGSSKKQASKSKRRKITNWMDKSPSFQVDSKFDKSHVPPKLDSPSDYFELFFDSTLRNIIIEETNRYASQKNIQLNFGENEFFVFIGGLMLSGTSPSPNKRRYWSNGDHVPKILAKNIRRDRFLQILRNFHFTDNSKIDKTQTKLLPLFEKLQNNFIEHGYIPEFSSVDESMVPYYGKHHTKQFIRGKPIRFGFKFWAHCSKKGYLHSFEFYTRKTDDSAQNYDELGVGGNVVMRLIEKTRCTEERGCKIFFDNFFTSIPLMNLLTEKEICCMGTARENRLQKCPLITKKEISKKPRGFIQSVVSETNLFVQKWKDNKDVTLVSNFGSDKVSSTQRYDRTIKKYKDVPQPINFQTYNKHMGYVDLMDQRISTYRIRMRQRKWWWQIFCYLLSAALNNAFVLMSEHDSKITFLEFLDSITIKYLNSFGSESLRGKKILPNITLPKRYDQYDHMIIFDEKSGRRCAQCKVKSKFLCEKCEIGLHPKCFKEWHTKPKH